MANASNIFPLLPVKDLSLVLIKIFQHLNQDQDIHKYRLVNKDWKTFIDSHILSSPFHRQKFLQHPLGVPPDQRISLIKAQLDHGYRPSAIVEVLEKGQYVLVKKGLAQLLVFTKTNAALMPAGSVALQHHSELGYDMGNSFASCQDYLFQLYSNAMSYYDIPKASLRLQPFKKEGETWIMCEHPARHLWEQEGTEILGMRQVSESKVLLLALNKTEDHLQAIDLSDGAIELTTRNIVTKRQLIGDKKFAVDGKDSLIFGMDAFGLVIYSDWITLQHFSFETKEQTWQTVFEKSGCKGTIRKARKVTIFKRQILMDLVIVDNTSGVVKYRVEGIDLGAARYCISNAFEVMPSDDYLFLGIHKLPASLTLEVFNISESKMMSFPVTVPKITLDRHCYMEVCMISKQSKSTVLYTLNIVRKNPSRRILWSGVVRLDARQPGKMIVLSHPKESGEFVGCVSCEHGFFALNRCQCETHLHCIYNALESWKY